MNAAELVTNILQASTEYSIIGKSLDGTIQLWNEGARRLYGYEAAEVVGIANSSMLYVPEDVKAGKPREILDLTLANGKWEETIRQRRKDGKHFTARFVITLRRDAAGKAIGFLLITKDITDDLRRHADRLENEVAERRRVEASLRESEEKYRVLWETTTDAVILLDETNVIRYANHAIEQVFGYKPEEAVGKEISMLQPERLRQQHHRGLRRYIETGEKKLNWRAAEAIGLRRDGREVPIEIAFSDMTLGGRRLFAAFIRDITERKRVEAELAAHVQELARSNAELERFAYVASHDLQEPLRSVTSYTQLLTRRYGGKGVKDADEFVGYITDAVQRMKGLIEGLLSYSRVSRQYQTFEFVDLNLLLGTALENLQSVIKDGGATVIHTPLPTLRVDSQQVTQLFQNLIGNALKFRGEAAPEVHVSAERSNGDWAFSVRDNGIGVEPQYTERIFALFQRLHHTEEYPGSGIGLTICKKIVEGHGGHIWVEPGNPGSVFRFTLRTSQ